MKYDVKNIDTVNILTANTVLTVTWMNKLFFMYMYHVCMFDF